ncbi:hypothetical protein [Burkholderia pyrrocinia]|uniref:hypothetical protein n=1 Tax=Burkholderia pyrrocinia TaxID=60550 RepID=UPI0030CB7D2E
MSEVLDYDLSERSSTYIQGAYQHATGNTGTDFDSAHVLGTAGQSPGRNQLALRVGMMHRF